MKNQKIKTPITLAVISLGCPKNQVDTETVIGQLCKQGVVYCEEPEQSDWLLINTCSFIQSAEEETIQVLLNAANLKKKNKQQRLIVVGCMVKKYGEKKLKQLIPEIDLAIPPDKLADIEKYIQDWVPTRVVNQLELTERHLLSGPGTAFLKITEGCSRKCAFCLIPSLRGPLHSKPIDVIVNEAERLVRQGAKELVVVAQDTASYGRDLKNKETLEVLIDQLVKIRQLKWLRLMYLNPDSIKQGLIDRIAREKKICHYLDMPVQHASFSVLKKMHRSGSGEKWLSLIASIRKQIPDISLRTTVLTGFPGETEKDHQILLEFIRQAQFDRLGAFVYSKEKGTSAASMPDQVHYATKKRRQKEIMTLQENISNEQLKKRIGQNVSCLVEEHSGSEYVIARTQWDAPEIDGSIILKGYAEIGQFVNAKILGSTTHDLNGELV